MWQCVRYSKCVSVCVSSSVCVSGDVWGPSGAAGCCPVSFVDWALSTPIIIVSINFDILITITTISENVKREQLETGSTPAGRSLLQETGIHCTVLLGWVASQPVHVRWFLKEGPQKEGAGGGQSWGQPVAVGRPGPLMLSRLPTLTNPQIQTTRICKSWVLGNRQAVYFGKSFELLCPALKIVTLWNLVSSDTVLVRAWSQAAGIWQPAISPFLCLQGESIVKLLLHLKPGSHVSHFHVSVSGAQGFFASRARSQICHGGGGSQILRCRCVVSREYESPN